MSSKRLSPILLLICMFMLTACVGGGNSETQPVQGTEAGYAALYEAYMAKDVNANVTLTVTGDVQLENRFSLVQTGESYAVTDLASGESREFDNGDEAYKVAGYLPPYEITYADGDAYVCRLSGDINLEMLLDGSNIFDGYTYKDVSFDGECLYTARLDGGIDEYSYEFTAIIGEGEDSFTVDVKYFIEVNR